jgi:hypothetical protein
MNSRQKITRVHLKINKNDDPILLGIVSTEPDYKLSLALNKKLMISLKNITPLELTDETGTNLSFSRFSDLSGAPDLIFNLISNRSDNNFLLKKLKNVDFILHVQDLENNNKINQLTESLREIYGITAVFNIDKEDIKDKNLLYIT